MSESPDLLRERGLFAFDPPAEGEIAHEFEQIATQGQPVDPLLEELVCLTAAEYSLIRWMSYRGQVLPMQRPIQVEHGDAVLGFLKANCNPMFPFCFEQIERESRLTLADITAFSSDAAKLSRMEVQEVPELEDIIGDLSRAVDRIETGHRESPSPRAQALGDSGVLRLQGFLWAVKASLPRAELAQTMAEAHEAFELTQPVEERAHVPA
jgi:hypothetical protein